MQNPLGSCQKCGAGLCVSGRTIACDSCGLPHPDHPKMKEWEEFDKNPPPPPRAPQPLDYANTLPDRVKRLEESLAALTARVQALEAEKAETVKKKKGE